MCFTSSAMVAMRSYNHACHMAGWGSSAVTASGSSLRMIEGMRREFILWTFTLPPPRKPHKVFSPFLQRSAANWLLAQSRCSPGHIVLSVVDFSLEIVSDHLGQRHGSKKTFELLTGLLVSQSQENHPGKLLFQLVLTVGSEKMEGLLISSHGCDLQRRASAALCRPVWITPGETMQEEMFGRMTNTQDQEESRACLLFPSWLPDAAPTFLLLSSR